MRKNKCRGCKERFRADTLLSYPSGSFHSEDCAIQYAMKAGNKLRAKQQKAKVKQEKKDHREAKERVRPRKDWLDQLQGLVNQYVLHVRDKGKPCCTCGKTDLSVKYDAGHFLSRAASPETRFELTNIHKQCSVNCNQHGSGKRAEYNEFIIAKYGQAHYEWLIGPHLHLKDQLPHYTDIKKEILRYRQLIRDAGIKPYY